MSYRKLILKSGKWNYTIGKRDVVVRGPDRKRTVVGCHVLAGMHPDHWDDYIDNQGPGLGPGDVRKYIEENLV